MNTFSSVINIKNILFIALFTFVGFIIPYMFLPHIEKNEFPDQYKATFELNKSDKILNKNHKQVKIQFDLLKDKIDSTFLKLEHAYDKQTSIKSLNKDFLKFEIIESGKFGDEYQNFSSIIKMEIQNFINDIDSTNNDPKIVIQNSYQEGALQVSITGTEKNYVLETLMDLIKRSSEAYISNKQNILENYVYLASKKIKMSSLILEEFLEKQHNGNISFFKNKISETNTQILIANKLEDNQQFKNRNQNNLIIGDNYINFYLGAEALEILNEEYKNKLKYNVELFEENKKDMQKSLLININKIKSTANEIKRNSFSFFESDDLNDYIILKTLNKSRINNPKVIIFLITFTSFFFSIFLLLLIRKIYYDFS